MNFKGEESAKRFNHLWKELDNLYHEIALKRGMSDSAFSIIYAICELGDGCLQKNIREETCMSKQTINSSIQKLEEEGILYLKQGKGRDKHIHLTEAGKRMVDEKISPIKEIEQSAFLELSAKERQMFLQVVQKYVDIFRKKEQEL